MSATIGAAAITAGAGLLGSLFGAKKQDKNAQAQRDWQEEQYLFDTERELLGIDEWLPLFWHDELLGNITTLCGVDIVEGKPPVDERLILNSGLPIKERNEQRRKIV